MSCAATTLRPSRAEAVLSVRGLSKRFPASRDLLGRPTSWLRAVDFVDLDLYRGETLALVGESGCGKTTLARLVLRLLRASSGSVRFEHLDVLAASDGELREFRRRVQLVFQDPYGSLDPRKRVEWIVGEGMPRGQQHDREHRARVRDLLDLVGLAPTAASRFPHEFSGGERQRISIARALAVDPTLLIVDEPVSALDSSVQSRVLNLLAELQGRLGLTYLFISHDLSVVRHVADRVAVMYLGKIVETARTEVLFGEPLHPYTQALLSSEPRLFRESDGSRIVLTGETTSAVDPPVACRFAPRCFRRIDRCVTEAPALEAAGSGERLVACFNTAGTAAALELQGSPAAASVERRGRGNAFGRFVALRFAYSLGLLLISSILLFAALAATPADATRFPGAHEGYGLDTPLAAQYAVFLKNLVTGDLGVSLVSGAGIGHILTTAGQNTLELGFTSLVLVYALAIPLGMLAAWRHNSPFDDGVRLITVLAMGIPNFFLAILLIEFLALDLGWFPVAGPGGLRHLVLPAVVLALESLAINLRLMRSSALDELSKEYVTALRAKGLRESRILWLHVLRNAIVPLVAYAGTVVPTILGYTLVVEVIFRFEGLGYQLVQSILNHDYLLAQTLALLFAAAVIFSNFAADVGHRLLDPRVREQVLPA
jgi:oligopeptide transport system ATP-binding protein